MPTLLSDFLFADRCRVLRYRAALAMYVAIVVLGSVPGARAGLGHVASGLMLHGTAYSAITYLLLTGGAGRLPVRVLKAVATVALMGAGDEMVQSLFPYRHAAVGDWLVDCSAAAVTALMTAWLMRRQLGSSPTSNSSSR